MLVLSRKVGEKLVLGDNVIVEVVRIAGNRITLGIVAPSDVRILRGELQPKPVQSLPVKAKPAQTKPTQTKPVQAKPAQTIAAHASEDRATESMPAAEATQFCLMQAS